MSFNKSVPKHIAIIMDGNGRWAKKRLLPRVAGHIRGVKRVKEIIKHCAFLKVEYLTLFAFGRENWKRPKEEVSFLMQLLYDQLNKEFYQLHEDGVKIRFIGDRSRLSHDIYTKINELETLTSRNKHLNLNIALDYSGTYDIMQAINRIIIDKVDCVNEEDFNKYLLTYPDPSPDLFIRTSGEFRLSNFLLWQVAYSELYFTKVAWPDFKAKDLDKAIDWFNTRERRFGMTSEQLQE
ncbi:MAG: polyprenyl diphosphate synthase [Neisseriaceae bacterium]